MRKTNEKINKALPYPCNTSTSQPTKNTTVAVNIRLILKAIPVAVERKGVGNNSGIYTFNTPWLVPKNSAIKAIFKYASEFNAKVNLNNNTLNKKEPPKHHNMTFFMPKRLLSQPDETPPDKPPTAKIIMLIPRSRRPSESTTMLCTQVGSHAKTAHKPMSMAP